MLRKTVLCALGSAFLAASVAPLAWGEGAEAPLIDLEPRTPVQSAPAGGKPGGTKKNTRRAPGSTGSTKSGSRIHKNSLGMEFVLIPAGTFRMGCSTPTEGCESDELPTRKVTISRAFYLGRHEVTQAQWQRVMGDNPSKFQGANRPVENVSWEDAQAFIRKLNALEKHKRYRLPTEAEWEYAARAGSRSAYSFGADRTKLAAHAWFLDNAREGGARPVGRKRPNAWGLYDMHGNAREWVQDWFGPYSAGAAVNPKGPSSGTRRALRGGSWGSDAAYCRSSNRDEGEPGIRREYYGFRLALTPGR